MKLKYIKLTRSILLLVFLAVSFSSYAQHDLYGLWVKRAVSGSLGSANIKKTFTDKEGNVYVAGYFTGKMNFNDDICSPIYEDITPTQEGAFLAKYSNTGNFLWKVHFFMDKLPGYTIPTLNFEDAIYLDKSNMVVVDLTSASQYNISVCPPTLNAKHAGGVIQFTNNCTTPCSGSGAVWMGTGGLFFIDSNTGTIVNSKQHDCLEEWTVFAINGDGDLLRSYYLDARAGVPVKTSYLETYNSVTGTFISSKPYPQATFFEGYNATANQVFAPDGTIYALFRKNEGTVDGKPIITTAITKTNANFTSYTAQKTILPFHKDSPQNPLNPELEMATDATSELYLGFNFPHHNATISNVLNSGINFSSKQEYEKAVVMKVDRNLNYQWSFQLGANNTTDEARSTIKALKVYNNLLYVVGTFNGTIDFNPKGVAVSKTSTGSDGFYAIYDLNGICQKVILFEGANNESIESLSFIDGTNILLGGSYSSLSFQADPSGRLYPLSSNGTTTQGFIALYSTAPHSSPAPYPSSFGDAPASYGLAVHYAYPCLKIGNLNMNKLQLAPEQSIDANTSQNDDGISISYNGDFVDLSSANFKLDALGNLTAKVAVSNEMTTDAAKIIAWIDFNQNGVFDGASEASTVVTINPSSSATVNLVWTNAKEKLRNGTTYLRVRLTTDNMDNTQATGLFFNGEVEDYRLDLNIVELTKTAVSNNKISDTHANIGDTITYTLNIGNNTLTTLQNIDVFDPIPMHTNYVPNSANAGGMPTTLNLNGQSVNVIKWTLSSFATNANTLFTFKVVVIDRPKNSGIIPNIGYATIYGDTISSTGNNCSFAEITVNKLFANRDSITLLKNDSIDNFFIGANDSDPDRKFVIDSIIQHATNGTAALNTDGTLKYKPTINWFGIDSVEYQIKVPNDSVTTKAYFAVLNPLSQRYIACKNAKITLGFSNIPNVVYNWYTTATGGTAIKTNSNTLPVTKNNIDAIETWYVEVVYNGKINFPRYPVYLYMGTNCGETNPTGCAKDGTILWKEDFGGNNVSDPTQSSTPLASGITNYTFCAASSNRCILDEGNYSILKNTATITPVAFVWHNGLDHTYPNDPTKGYMFLANSGSLPNKFYEYKIDNLCQNTNLSFSAWIANLCKTDYIGTKEPYLKFELTDLQGNVLAIYTTGMIPRATTLTWKQYGFEFNSQDNSSIIMRIYNDGEGGEGNDLVLDDIEIRFCAPPVSINTPTNDTIICPAKPITFKGEYTDELGALGNNLKARWEFSTTGDINTPGDWSAIGSDVTSSTGSITLTHTIASVTAAKEGYYRMIIGKPSSIDMPNCRAASKVVRLKLNNALNAYPDVRVQICPNAGSINLSKYIDTLEFKSVAWSAISGPSIGATNGIVNANDFVSPHTYVYKYKVKNSCYEPEAKLYIRVLKDKTLDLPPDTVVVCKSDASAKYVNLNKIVGIEANGTLKYDNTVNPDNTVTANVTLAVAPAIYQGAYTFNAANAWSQATAAYLVTGGYNGDMNAKVFKFRFTAPAASCLGTTTKNVIVIVTEKIVP